MSTLIPTDDTTTQVPCPVCKALTGQPCSPRAKDKTGYGPRLAHHRSREKALHRL